MNQRRIKTAQRSARSRAAIGKLNATLVALAAAGAPCLAGTIRNDRLDADYRAYANQPQFASVGSYSTGSLFGSFTLIAPDWALTAAPNGFGYRADDHGDSFDDATEVALDITGKIGGDGIISRMTDADLFAFSTSAGNISFSLATAPFGGMLDSTLRLFASDGTLLQTADTRSLGESLTAMVSAGRYLLGVYGRGNYGDLGQYTLTGQLVPVPEPAALGLVLAAIPLVQRRCGRS